MVFKKIFNFLSSIVTFLAVILATLFVLNIIIPLAQAHWRQMGFSTYDYYFNYFEIWQQIEAQQKGWA